MASVSARKISLTYAVSGQVPGAPRPVQGVARLRRAAAMADRLLDEVSEGVGAGVGHRVVRTRPGGRALGGTGARVLGQRRD